MNLENRLKKRIPSTSGITKDNADLVLTRWDVLDPGHGSIKKLSLGTLKRKTPNGQLLWLSVHNLQYNNYLRQGPYKIRMFKRPSSGKGVLQVAAPYWGAILIHPTSNWRGLEGCISPILMIDFDTLKITGSAIAHAELMFSLGQFEEGKEFTLWVANNPETKPLGGQEQWFARKKKMLLRKMKSKAKNRAKK